ncbi:MAG: hypothetical protein GWN84_16705, partial [Gammaproteobacteria bacterium]|nr:hypothetical protein [Gammaproteobacteria bacterium]NIR84479.1 hypothetical protein [Gammaproteobacteria bacterium]NIR90382.1 hypothetical protein [Gammaproteobacteria bacterium]NIU05530.1 hypothetical protein [Gammaproteobacteria bacterium]NIV52669.1 hypothetical protein [Gammaproteobacteria bacterium]
MDWFRRKISVYLLALALALPGAALQSAAAAEAIANTKPSELDMAVDGLIIRPIGFVSIGVGAIVYGITFPFHTLTLRNPGAAWQRLIA